MTGVVKEKALYALCLQESGIDEEIRKAPKGPYSESSEVYKVYIGNERPTQCLRPHDYATRFCGLAMPMNFLHRGNSLLELPFDFEFFLQYTH